jgi:hypothetical protein
LSILIAVAAAITRVMFCGRGQSASFKQFSWGNERRHLEVAVDRVVVWELDIWNNHNGSISNIGIATKCNCLTKKLKNLYYSNCKQLLYLITCSEVAVISTG